MAGLSIVTDVRTDNRHCGGSSELGVSLLLWGLSILSAVRPVGPGSHASYPTIIGCLPSADFEWRNRHGQRLTADRACDPACA